jgi:hypothetical protein
MTPIVLWHPGTGVSTADVSSGLAHGLQANGVDVIPYATAAHITAAGWMLNKVWRLGKKSAPRPQSRDILYWANVAILETALRAACTKGAEWVLVVSGMYQHPDFVLMLRRAGLKVCVLLTESPYDGEAEARYASLADMVFTNERTSVESLRRVNPQTYYLPHAWHPGVHDVRAQAEAAPATAHEVVFVGTGFVERIRLLETIDWSGIDFGCYGIWSLVAPRGRLRPYLRGGETPNARTAALYRAATVGLNLHRTSMGYAVDAKHVTGAESMNPRCWELAASGLFFTTDHRAEVTETFGDVLPTFSTPAEAEAIVRRALREPQWRADVAAACRERVTDQTWTARAAMVLDALASYGRERAA